MERDGVLRIVIVDDHPMVRQVIRLACAGRPRLEIVGEASFGVEALEKCQELRPDVLILDLGLPDMDGIEVVRQLKSMGSPTRVLVVTGRDDRASVLSALREGVDGYLEKTGSIETIAASIEAVGSGTQVFSVEQRRGLQQDIGDLARRTRESARTAATLTGRERQVLAFIGQGMTTRQMARKLGLSERTVESHISSLYGKLGVSTRVQALHRAAGLGLVDLG